MLAAMLSEISGYVSFNLGNDFKLICGRRVLFIFILLNIFSAFEFLLSTVPKKLKMEKKTHEEMGKTTKSTTDFDGELCHDGPMMGSWYV